MSYNELPDAEEIFKTLRTYDAIRVKDTPTGELFMMKYRPIVGDRHWLMIDASFVTGRYRIYELEEAAKLLDEVFDLTNENFIVNDGKIFQGSPFREKTKTEVKVLGQVDVVEKVKELHVKLLAAGVNEQLELRAQIDALKKAHPEHKTSFLVAELGVAGRIMLAMGDEDPRP
jgi:hypothetical protein